MVEKNKKLKCSKCGQKGLYFDEEDNAYWCAMCGASTNPDGTPYIDPPRQYYICPRCGKGWDYADKDQHICKNCHYEPMIKTEFSDIDYENARTSSPETFRQFKMNLREKYTINSDVFDSELYNDLITKEYKSSLEREAREIQKQKEIALSRNKIHCPKCNSTNVTTGQLGYSFLAGFLGSNKTVNRCGNCGYKWEPGK